MEEINKYKVVKAMVRGFFEGYFSGLIDSRAANPEQKHDVIFVKQMVAEYYSSVSSNFVNVVFPLLLAMNFDSYEQATEDMKKRRLSDSTPLKLLLRYACRDKNLYDVIIKEYKEQMSVLLLGHIQYPNEHIKQRNMQIQEVSETDFQSLDIDHAIRTVTRSSLHSYSLGIKASQTGKMSLHQPTVLRMMVNCMVALLHDEPLDIWKDAEEIGLDGVYRRVSRNDHNYETLINEMNQAYEDLAIAEGIISNDDTLS